MDNIGVYIAQNLHYYVEIKLGICKAESKTNGTVKVADKTLFINDSWVWFLYYSLTQNCLQLVKLVVLSICLILVPSGKRQWAIFIIQKILNKRYLLWFLVSTHKFTNIFLWFINWTPERVKISTNRKICLTNVKWVAACSLCL